MFSNTSSFSFCLSFVLTDPVSVDLDQYDVGSLTDALRGFLQDLPAPVIPATVYSELVYTAQGTVRYTATYTGALMLVVGKTVPYL